jgi:hypothetical protein
MIDDVYIRTESKALRASNDTERFGVKSVGTTDGLFEYARKDDFSICRTSFSVRYTEDLVDITKNIPSYFEGWRSHWGEFRDYLKDAIELALG